MKETRGGKEGKVTGAGVAKSALLCMSGREPWPLGSWRGECPFTEVPAAGQAQADRTFKRRTTGRPLTGRADETKRSEGVTQHFLSFCLQGVKSFEGAGCARAGPRVPPADPILDPVRIS